MSLVYILIAIYRLYQYGHDINLSKLYPEIQFPVGRGTPMLSPLVRWKHDKDWYIIQYEPEDTSEHYQRIVTINVREREWEYLTGHVVDGKKRESTNRNFPIKKSHSF